MCVLTHILSSLFITLAVDTKRQDSCQVDVMRKELEEIDKNKVCTWNNIDEGRTLSLRNSLKSWWLPSSTVLQHIPSS